MKRCKSSSRKTTVAALSAAVIVAAGGGERALAHVRGERGCQPLDARYARVAPAQEAPQLLRKPARHGAELAAAELAARVIEEATPYIEAMEKQAAA